MNPNLVRVSLFAGGLVFLPVFLSGCVAPEAQLSRIPAAASAALKKAAGSATITNFERQKTGSITLYAVDLEELGKPHREVAVTEDGNLYRMEENIPFENIPFAVRKMIRDREDRTNLVRVNRINWVGGAITYEAVYKKGWRKTEMEFFGNGEQRPLER